MKREEILHRLALTLEEELGAIYPANPTGTVVDLMSYTVLVRLANAVVDEMERLNAAT